MVGISGCEFEVFGRGLYSCFSDLPEKYCLLWVCFSWNTSGLFSRSLPSEFSWPLDSSIVVVGLPQVVSDLKTNLVVGVWIITIYRLMITVLLVGIGPWADIHGRVRSTTWASQSSPSAPSFQVFLPRLRLFSPSGLFRALE